MKIILQEDNYYLLRFDKGENILDELIDFSTQKNIQAAHFTCIGSSKELILSYYNLKTKEYEDHVIQEDLEVISITGNIAYKDNKPIIHAHGVFSKHDLSTIGGHIKKLVVSATCEVSLTTFSMQITRTFDPDTGLNLLT
jgi:predicted DNA-binding protein with PD1-like motif